MQTEKDKIIAMLLSRRDWWQQRYDAAKVDDFFNANNYKAMVAELNAIILAVNAV